MKMELLPFGRNDIDNILRINPERAHDLPFGAILLNRSGKVLNYNAAEGCEDQMSPAAMVGKDFFKDIASRAVDTPLYEEFLKFHQRGFANVVIDYAFDDQGQNAAMRIHLKSTEDGAACWIFVKLV